MIEPFQSKALKRLKRARGQIDGIIKMIENSKYCDDIITQILALQAAVKGVTPLVLESHLNTCATEHLNSKEEEKDKNLFVKSFEPAISLAANSSYEKDISAKHHCNLYPQRLPTEWYGEYRRLSLSPENSQAFQHDFGAITEIDSHTFVMTNRGNDPLSVVSAVSSCTCLNVELETNDASVSPSFSMRGLPTGTKIIIPPGENLEVHATLDPSLISDSKNQKFRATISLMTRTSDENSVPQVHRFEVFAQ